MRSAKDFQAWYAAQLRTHHAVEDLGVRSARSLFEPGEGLEEHERGGGGHFSPRLEGSSACKHRNFIVLPAFFFDRKPTAEAGKQGRRGRIYEPRLLISGSTGERAKLLRQA
jgi:hypothetical protein